MERQRLLNILNRIGFKDVVKSGRNFNFEYNRNNVNYRIYIYVYYIILHYNDNGNFIEYDKDHRYDKCVEYLENEFRFELRNNKIKKFLNG